MNRLRLHRRHPKVHNAGNPASPRNTPDSAPRRTSALARSMSGAR